MGEACIKAYHEMEERYARLVLQYFSTDQRNTICDTVGDMIKDFEIAPSVMVTPSKDFGGEYSIEFHDDYDRNSHKFFEKLIESLGLDHCEVDI